MIDPTWTELPRPHDLAPRRWKTETGEIIGEAVNAEAIELLKTDPDEYFRRTSVGRWGDSDIDCLERPRRDQ